jgi:thiamine monophosphate kinase
VIQEKLPISEDLRQAALELKLDPYELFLQDSDDYELIITSRPKNAAQVRAAVASVDNVPVTEVGKITDSVGDIQLILPDGTKRHVTPVGWDHFAKGGEDV